MRFEVPQYIDIEDRIFGPLSWHQFLYLGGGMGMAIALFLTTPLWVFIIFGLPIALVSGALAFYPINNRPFSHFLEAVFSYVTNGRLYLWRQKKDPVHRDRVEKESSPLIAPPSRPNRSGDVASLARKLELQALQRKEQ